MFRQSRRVAQLNWQKYIQSSEISNGVVKLDIDDDNGIGGVDGGGNGDGAPDRGNDFPLPRSVYLDESQLSDTKVHDVMFELNTLRMHVDLWDAAERNPLSVIYSATWTLCASLPPPVELFQSDRSRPSSDEAVRYEEYYGNWFPFILLHRYMDRLHKRNHLSAGDVGAEIPALFTVEQLIEADKRYVAAFEQYKAFKDTPQLARDLYERYEQEFLLSPVFDTLANGTPFGAIERRDRSTIDYVTPLANVREKRRLTNLFKRIESYETLRVQCEQRVRNEFPDTVAPFRLTFWLMPMLRRDEDTTAFPERHTESREHYVMYWQYQKSEIVWFVLHTLFALNQLVQDDQLSLDLLFFVSEYLERLVECGVCHEHWKRTGKELWRMYEREYTFLQHQWDERRAMLPNVPTAQLETLAKSASFVRIHSTLAEYHTPADLYMLQTHNNIQTENVAPNKRLTQSCIESIRDDYLYFALLLEANVSAGTASEIGRRSSNILQIAKERADVLQLESDIYLGDMLRVCLIEKTDRIATVAELRRHSLSRERRSLYNLVAGRVV